MANTIERAFPTENRPASVLTGGGEGLLERKGGCGSCSGQLSLLQLERVFSHENQMCKWAWAPPPHRRVTEPGRGMWFAKALPSGGRLQSFSARRRRGSAAGMGWPLSQPSVLLARWPSGRLNVEGTRLNSVSLSGLCSVLDPAELQQSLNWPRLLCVLCGCCVSSVACEELSLAALLSVLHTGDLCEISLEKNKFHCLLKKRKGSENHC